MPTPRQYANRAQRQAAYRNRQADRRREELSARAMPPLPPIPSIPGNRRWAAMTQHALYLLQKVTEEMHDYYDERSEAWQESERADAFLERLQAVEAAADAAEDSGF